MITKQWWRKLNVYEKERNLFTRCYYMNLNDEKWLYSLETILYKKTTTILNNKSVLLFIIPSGVGILSSR